MQSPTQEKKKNYVVGTNKFTDVIFSYGPSVFIFNCDIIVSVFAKVMNIY